MENADSGSCQKEVLGSYTFSKKLYKNTVKHTCDDESGKILSLYLEQIKYLLDSCLPKADTGYYNELYRQSKQIDELLLFVQNSKFIIFDLFLSPIEFFLTRTQIETNKFIEEVSIPNIHQHNIIDLGQIEKIINNVYNFNYFKFYDLMNFEFNWISERNDDLFTVFYQKGIELLWSKSYENAKKSFLQCKSISEKIISYEKVCKEIINLALKVAEHLWLEKETREIELLINQTEKTLRCAFPLSSNLIFYEISKIYVSTENYNKAIECGLECLKNIQEEKCTFYIWIYIGFLYQCALDFENAKIYYDKCENSISSNLINSQSDLENWYLNIAQFHIIKGEHKTAIDKLFLRMHMLKKNPINYKIYINFCFKIGEAYNYMNDFKKSKKYYNKAIKLSQQYSEIYLISIYLKVSEFYLKNFEFEKAQKIAKSCKKLCKKWNFIDKIVFAAIYRILGIIKFHQGNYEKCELFLHKSLNICENNNSYSGLYFIIGLNILGFYILNYNYYETERYIQKLNEKIENLKSKNYNSFLSYDILSTFYIMSYNIDKASIIMDIWQYRRSTILQYDINEKCEFYSLNAIKSIFLKNFKDSEEWMMKWKELQANLDKSQFFKFNIFLRYIYFTAKRIPTAINTFIEAIKYFKNILDYENPKLGCLYMHLAILYANVLELVSSINCMKEAHFAFKRKSQSKEILFMIYNNLAVFSILLDGEDSNNYFQKAKDLYSNYKVKNKRSFFEFHINQAVYWISKDNITEARIWIEKSKKLSYNKTRCISEIDLLEATTLVFEGNYRKAKAILIKGLKWLLYNNDCDQNLFECFYKSIAVCCQKLNQINKHEKYMEKYNQLLIKRNAPICTDDAAQLRLLYWV